MHIDKRIGGEERRINRLLKKWITRLAIHMIRVVYLYLRNGGRPWKRKWLTLKNRFKIIRWKLLKWFYNS